MSGNSSTVAAFVAPLCARDEAARNLALAVARDTVEGWLNNNSTNNNNNTKSSSNNNNNNNNNNSNNNNGYWDRGSREVPNNGYHRTSSPEGADCVDGRLDDDEPACNQRARLRQKQFDEEEAGARVYGKSPKFDDGLASLKGVRGRPAVQQQWLDEHQEPERVVFNTLDCYFTESPRLQHPVAVSPRRPLVQVAREPDRLLAEAEVVTPADVGRMLNLGSALDGPRQAQPNKYISLVSLHLPVILRLSVNCPFQNVRTKCAEIVQMIKDRGLPVPELDFDGPSAFVPASEMPDLDNLDEKTHMLLMEAFMQNNRLDHVVRVVCTHPTYLEQFLRTQNFILRGDGPLPYDYRHLIAIMASARHQCSYLINLQKSEFLRQGGDESWLQGLKSMPGKLQDLQEINKILAHRPWLLNKTHIEKLTKGSDSWSLAEVVQAIVLLAHFHALSSFVFSCGVNEELDDAASHLMCKENVPPTANLQTPLEPNKQQQLGCTSPPKQIIIPNGFPRRQSGKKQQQQPSPPASPCGEQEVGVETLMERMKRLSEKNESYSITQEELSKRFESVETQSAELAAAPQRNSVLLDSDIGLFIDDPSYVYQDFAKRGQLNDIPIFRVQDYSWDDHGYSLVNRLYNDVGNLLDDKFKTAYNLTYYTMGTHSRVDTSRFRRAIWNYIQCMFGIMHDDYDYNEINQLVESSLKTFIKNAVCYPERVTKRDYDRVMREFKHSEKIHVSLMILEARMQAELLYALRAVMLYMT
ncbi:sestrin-3 [Copidosoma floridanum]|uniref:sestrin-3 n=1 Tax=Copidosoma floridanum TaxID=29053 RepID=UPI0006C94DBA|nr:sestrin-3 [Copidosoma floridanum]